MQTKETTINTSTSLQNQLLATKFFVPVAPGTLIARPRLTTLLQESLKHPLTLVSTPAGFGKTTLLSAWAQSSQLRLAWVSLDEEDNEPHLFWTAVIAALDMHHPGRFTPLLTSLQALQGPPLKYVLTVLINLLGMCQKGALLLDSVGLVQVEKLLGSQTRFSAKGRDDNSIASVVPRAQNCQGDLTLALGDNREHFVLILDDYQMITEQHVHITLSYLVEHLPPQLHIILSTRTDPPLPLSQLRARRQILEVRTHHLRCTTEETKEFFDQTIGTHLPDEIIQEVTTRTEGWLVGLQLLALSLPACPDPTTLLQEVSGNQRYILDFLTDEVLQRPPQEVQTFLLSTCILQHLSASLCDAVTGQTGSQQMLQQLEQANLFVVSLDSRHQWYRYHALFAQALHYRLELTHPDLVSILHYRASLWYAQHNQITEAILHASNAKEWQWAADLIERILTLSFSWGADEHKQILLREWLQQLPTDIVQSRPRLCLACIHMLWQVASYPMLQSWLDAAETTLTASLTRALLEENSQTQQEQKDLLGEVYANRAFLQSYQEDGQAVLAFCQQALDLVSTDNFIVRSYIATTQLTVYYNSDANNGKAAVDSGLRASHIAQTARLTTLAIVDLRMTAQHMLGTGQLHAARRLTEQAIQQGRLSAELVLPEIGWPTLWLGEILREWNQLGTALEFIEEAISLCLQSESLSSLTFVLIGYGILLRVLLSCGELEKAHTALQQVERMRMNMNHPLTTYALSHFTTIDQIRLWLACGELDHAMRWAEQLKQHRFPFVREREKVAYVHILLAKQQPTLALQQLEPVLQRATTGQRWGHVIEIRLLQALAHQMCNEETQALDTLSQAVQLAEPEGYIRSFVDEGPPMARLLARLREQQHKDRPTPYLDTLLAAFPSQSQVHKDPPKQAAGHTLAHPLVDPLSEREREVLQLLARGASNQEIAQELVIVVDTVKRHVSHIFSKLGVNNRVQAVRLARMLGLMDTEDGPVSR